MSGSKLKHDLTGKRFDYFRVLHRCAAVPGKRTLWHCKCDCGETFEAEGHHLVSESKTSCGCQLKVSNSGTMHRMHQGLRGGYNHDF